jgi:2-polyprenyl-3-methyl-5-hydroxy-6-metoxy-1,4-benzoquinol methylase
MDFPYIHQFEKILAKNAPFLASRITSSKDLFGDEWALKFEETLQKFFGGHEEQLERIVQSFIDLTIQGTRLEREFAKVRKYISKSYDEASEEVYHNEDYMYKVYLPGLLLSNFLWPLHYRQLSYMCENFIPRILAAENKSFCDIGIGTGFFSRAILASSQKIVGKGFDISKYSLSYTENHINAFGFSNQWSSENRNVITNPPGEQWPFLISVEVLEHLENPKSLLQTFRKMLARGGTGFVSAAITAPQPDHIYLYNNCREIKDQLVETGFKIIEFTEIKAYEPKNEEPVPRLGAFIVQ